MAQDRIEWADERGQQEHTEVFKGMRAGLLPEWLRRECSPASVKSVGALFPETGVPYRAEYFL